LFRKPYKIALFKLIWDSPMSQRVSYVKRLVSSFSSTLLSALAPFRMQMESIGMDVREYSEERDDKLEVIVGIKISFANVEAYEKFVGRKRKIVEGGKQ
jgi:hypothetical protein